MDLLADLVARGLVHNTTDHAALAARLRSGPVGMYIGFDPTADSLHAGHLVGQLFMRRFQLAGHRPVALAGGATGMIGDPGGRSEERNLLDEDTLRHNVELIKTQLSRLLDFEPGPFRATLVNNADWTAPLSMLEFLRDVGKHFTVNQMIAKDSVRSRLASEAGISYTEFSYMLLQANDFRHLYEHHDVELQGGASDQWGNIVAGVELVRRRLGKQAFAITHPLMTKADGEKFGKSVGGAVWLDPARTSPYQFRQFWMQTDDQLIDVYLKMLSMGSVAELDAILDEHASAPQRRVAQRALAQEMTAMVHGQAAAAAVEQAASLLFGGDPSTASAAALAVVAAEVPCVDIPTELSGTRVHELLIAAGISTSTSEVGRLLSQGAIRAGNRVLGGDGLLDSSDLLKGGFLLLRKGKRDFAIGKTSMAG
ncbi:MAG: tyrS [Acidimicrobiaceae bacterium]|jgi:tyrosyl-tRNA synthetase|nr:MAG: tyrS [Acidimicrobiaceae bacterium]